MDEDSIQAGTVHVAIIPLELPETSLVKKVAEITNKDLYETRLLLTGKIPKIIGYYNSDIEAKSVVEYLRLLGLEAYSYTDEEFQKPQASAVEFVAHDILFEEGKARFLARNGMAKLFGVEDIFLIIHGKIRCLTKIRETESKMKLSIPATLMTGGIPVLHRSQTTTENESINKESFIWLYTRLSHEPEVQIFESNFNYACLGNKIVPSTLKNLEILLQELEKIFHKAVVDNRLEKCLPTIDQDDIARVCKLIDLHYYAKLDLN